MTICSEHMFEGRIWVLIASVPDLCILLLFCIGSIIHIYKQENNAKYSRRNKAKYHTLIMYMLNRMQDEQLLK